MLLIVSVDRANKSNSMNVANRRAFRKFLDKLDTNYVIARGYFEGEMEVSFVIDISLTDSDVDDYIIRVCFDLFEQDSVLKVKNSGASWLFFNDASRYLLGQWTSVSKEEAEQSIGYTHEGNCYYICK